MSKRQHIALEDRLMYDKFFRDMALALKKPGSKTFVATKDQPYGDNLGPRMHSLFSRTYGWKIRVKQTLDKKGWEVLRLK